ncbi:MAG: DEAD/DEAH box helicase [Chloroflexi bacterium]|nr:DEAD/DEAH box helicase [Chloroflexota bacterium]
MHKHLLELWSREPTIASNIVEWHIDEERPAQLSPFPPDLHPDLCRYLKSKGINALYSHQLESWNAARSGENVVIVTGTASGKTLGYNLPVLDQALRDPQVRALYLFPTKALTQDQYQGLTAAAPSLQAAIYDGDTPANQRQAIRSKARLILSNPDMLHTGILPHHTRWAEFFRGLRFVVIDEIHVYRGVFGSHIANLIRRLKRIAAFYGAYPQFFLTSATIANPGQLAERLIELPVTVIDRDGSPRGRRDFLLYNPPVVNADLGLRASATSESVRLTGDLLEMDIQTLLFCRTRRTVEMMLMYLQQSNAGRADALRSYRSGYLPKERREIERSLRQGTARAVVATNALELGIDIGGMDAVILVGYPGSIASTRQQAGRAGRRQGSSLAVMVASSNPLDQFLMQHPEYIFDRSPEQALINPDNLLILLKHLRCAAFELPFRRGDRFGNLPGSLLESILELLAQSGDLHASGDKYFWMADKYPAEQVSLRSSSPNTVVLQLESGGSGSERTIGEVDYESALWMVHPQAIYLHGGQMFEVQQLDLENNIAHLRTVEVDYFTEPKKNIEIEKLSLSRQSKVTGGERSFGEVMVTTQVTGYRRVRWYTNEVLGEGDLDLPATKLRTTGYWITLDSEVVNGLRSDGLWSSDPNQYGPAWPLIRKMVLERDGFTCQSCGASQNATVLHVHHKIPFRSFTNPAQANHLDNLVTLCPSCHHRAELSVKIKSGLSGLSYVLLNLSPLFLMCDVQDLGAQSDPLSPLADKQPAVVIYDIVPGGIGLSDTLYNLHDELMARAYELVSHCGCQDGCPSCVGPAGVNGVGGKEETLALLSALCGKSMVEE